MAPGGVQALKVAVHWWRGPIQSLDGPLDTQKESEELNISFKDTIRFKRSHEYSMKPLLLYVTTASQEEKKRRQTPNRNDKAS